MPSLFGNSFFIHSVARESVLFLIFDAHSFLPDHCVGLFLDFGSAGIVRRRFFSVLVVNDGDSEIVSFFGRASFVLYLRSNVHVGPTKMRKCPARIVGDRLIICDY